MNAPDLGIFDYNEEVPHLQWPPPDFPLMGELPLSVERKYAEEAYKEYSFQFHNDQELNDIMQRGGFHVAEIVHLLYCRIKRLEERCRVVEGSHYHG